MLGNDASARKDGSPVSPNKKASALNLIKSPSKLDMDRDELQSIKAEIDAKVKRMKTFKMRKTSNDSPSKKKPSRFLTTNLSGIQDESLENLKASSMTRKCS